MPEHQSEPGDDPGETLKLPDSGYPPRPPQPQPQPHPQPHPQPPRPQPPRPAPGPSAPGPSLREWPGTPHRDPAGPPGTPQPPSFPAPPQSAPQATPPAFLPALPPEDTPPAGGGHQTHRRPPQRRRPSHWPYWVVGAAVVSALAAGGIVLAASGGSDEPATTSAAPSASTPGTGVRTPASAAPSSTLSLAQARLADLLDPFEMRNCRPSPVEGTFNADAALVCDADDVGEVRALHYFDTDALSDEIRQRSGAVNDVGRCADGEDSVESWGRSTRRLGTLMCFSNAEGSHLFWTVDENLVAFEVKGPDGAELVSWWRRFDPLA